MTEEDHAGIPTRAIHEAYLEMQSALKNYRTSKDRGTNAGRAHGEVQESVITLYTMLRPHLKNNDAVNDWWHGELPSYNSGMEPADPEDGKGVLQVQNKTDTKSLEGIQNPQQLNDLEAWHDALDLNGNVRLTMVNGMGDHVFISYQAYQIGLRHIDSWETRFNEVEQSLGGFMADKTTTSYERQRVSIKKLKRAAWELSDVAEKLGALSEFNATLNRTEITDEQIDRLEEWREDNVQ